MEYVNGWAAFIWWVGVLITFLVILIALIDSDLFSQVWVVPVGFIFLLYTFAPETYPEYKVKSELRFIITTSECPYRKNCEVVTRAIYKDVKTGKIAEVKYEGFVEAEVGKLYDVSCYEFYNCSEIHKDKLNGN